MVWRHPHFQVHWAPNSGSWPQWTDWAARWLGVISAFPVQRELVDSMWAIATIVSSSPEPQGESVLDTIVTSRAVYLMAPLLIGTSSDQTP